MLKRERGALASGAEGSRSSKRRKEEGGGTSSDVEMSTADMVGGQDAEAEEEDVKENGLKLWQTVKDAVNNDGRHLSLNFLRQPSKRQYPDYYNFIQRPIALEDIKRKLDSGAYPTLEAVRQDFELCFSNAKLYNRPESDIYNDAKELLKLANKTFRKLMPADENGENAKTPSMKRLLNSRFQRLISKTDDSGRVLSSEFMELPSRKLWPYYYKEIQKPQCLDNIQKHVKRKEYSSVEDFAADVELVFSNAMAFNQEHTQIWEDALALRDYFRVLMSDLPPPFALPQYSKPSKNKIKIKMPASQSIAPPKVEESPNPPTISLRVPAPSKASANNATVQATSALTPATSACPETTTPAPAPTVPPPPPVKAVPVQPTAPVSQPTAQPRPYTNVSFVHKPQPSYTAPTPAPVVSPAPAPSTFVSTHRSEVAKVVSSSNSPVPPAVPVHQLKSVQLITEPRGRPLRLDVQDGVKSWAMRLERDERSLSVQDIVFEDDDDDSSGEEDGEEDEAEIETDIPAKPGPGRKKKRGRGRPPKVHKAPAPKPKAPTTKKKIKKIGEVQVKLNGAVIKELEEASGKWNLDLNARSNVVEVGEKGGLIWKVYAERTG